MAPDLGEWDVDRAPFSDTVLRIAELLHGRELLWAFTGGANLLLQGLDVPYNDIDIETDARSAYLAQEILGGTIVLPVSFSTSAPYRSHFGKTMLDGWLVEIMGAVQKLRPDGSWTPAPDLTVITRRVAYHGECVPVLNLQYEADAYDMSGRPDRAARIRLYLGRSAQWSDKNVSGRS